MPYSLEVPKKFGVPITEKCHLRCSFCMNSNDIFSKARHMSLDVFKIIINWLAEQSVSYIDLTPIVGEPLLVPNLDQFLNFIEGHPKIVAYDLFTSLAVKNINSILNRKKLKLYISLYGFNQQQFLETTQRDVFELLIKNLKTIVLNKPEKKVTILQRVPDSKNIYLELKLLLKMSSVFFFKPEYLPNRDNKMAERHGVTKPCNFMYEPIVNDKGLSLCCKDIDNELKIAEIGGNILAIYQELFSQIKKKKLLCNPSCGWFEPLSQK